jgi:hypothetical protein
MRGGYPQLDIMLWGLSGQGIRRRRFEGGISNIIGAPGLSAGGLTCARPPQETLLLHGGSKALSWRVERNESSVRF